MSILVVSANVTTSHSEDDDSPTEIIDGENSTAHRVLRCAWNDRHRLITQLLGGWSISTGGGWIMHRGQEYPHAVGVGLYASKITGIKPEGKAQGTAKGTKTTPTHAIIDLDYAFAKRDSGEDEDETETLFSERLEPLIQFLQLEPRSLKWEDTTDDEPIDPLSVPKLQVRSLVWAIDRERLPGLTSAMVTTIGTVNSAAVESPTLGVTFSAGTLLYEPPALDREWGMKANPFWPQVKRPQPRSWTGAFRCAYQPNGWNKWPKVVGAAIVWTEFTDMHDDGAPLKVYPEADFSQLMTDIFTAV